MAVVECPYAHHTHIGDTTAALTAEFNACPVRLAFVAAGGAATERGLSTSEASTITTDMENNGPTFGLLTVNDSLPSVELDGSG